MPNRSAVSTDLVSTRNTRGSRHLIGHLFALSLLLSLSGCVFFAKKPTPAPGNPLAVANCPADLPPLTDDTFGGANRKIVEIAGIYHQCAISARGAVK